MTRSYEEAKGSLRRYDLMRWFVQSYPETDSLYIIADRGDAYVEMMVGRRVFTTPEGCETYTQLITAQLDEFADEWACKESGGHRYVDLRCEKCLAVDLESLSAAEEWT